LLVSLALLLPLLSGTLRVSDVGRTLVRNNFSNDRVQLNLDDELRAEATLKWPSLSVNASYSPRVSLIDSTRASRSYTLMQSAELGMEHRRARMVLALNLSGTMGVQSYLDIVAARKLEPDLSTEPPTADAAAQTVPAFNVVPQAQLLSVASGRSQARLFYLWAPRWSSELRAGVSSAGGLGADATRILPRQSSAEGSAEVSYALTSTQRLGLLGSGSYQWTSQALRFWLFGLSAELSTRLSRDTDSRLSVGVLRQQGHNSKDKPVESWLSAARAQLRSSSELLSPLGLQLIANVEYRPVINLLLATLQQRLSATVGADLRYERVSLGLGVSALQTVPLDAPDMTRGIGVSGNLLYQASDCVAALLGAQAGEQSIRGAAAPSFLLWSVFLGVAVNTEPLKL
jgi:hypothetical protein